MEAAQTIPLNEFGADLSYIFEYMNIHSDNGGLLVRSIKGGDSQIFPRIWTITKIPAIDSNNPMIISQQNCVGLVAEHKSEVGVLWYYQLRFWFFLFIQQMLFQAHSHKCEISNVIVVSSQRSLSKYNFLFCMPFLWAHWIRCRLSKCFVVFFLS